MPQVTKETVNQPITTLGLIPHLVCPDGHAAVAFYQEAFGAVPEQVLRFEDGRFMHAAIRLGGSWIFIGEASPAYHIQSPKDLGGSPVTMHLKVDNCDRAHSRALQHGCTCQMAPADMFWGDRYAVVTDPFGHRWSFAQTLRELSPEEMEQAAANFKC